LLYAKINVKSNHFLFLTSLESPLHKGGSEGVWKYRWLPTEDWLFPFVRLEAIVSGVSVISDFPINYRLAVIGGEEGLVDDANAKIVAAL